MDEAGEPDAAEMQEHQHEGEIGEAAITGMADGFEQFAQRQRGQLGMAQILRDALDAADRHFDYPVSGHRAAILGPEADLAGRI